MDLPEFIKQLAAKQREIDDAMRRIGMFYMINHLKSWW